jgi:hypothetical protein
LRPFNRTNVNEQTGFLEPIQFFINEIQFVHDTFPYKLNWTQIFFAGSILQIELNISVQATRQKDLSGWQAGTGI